MRFVKTLLLLCLFTVCAQAQAVNLWRPRPNPTPPPCPQIRQFYNLSSAFSQIDCNGVITTISSGANLQDPGANGILARTALNTTVARTLLGTTNRIVVTNGNGLGGDPTFDIGSTVATSGNNLSFFSPTTSAQLAGVVSDETGSGALVFNISPSLTTPTIASFINAAHNHEAAAGGGQLNASNVFNVGTIPLARGGTGSSLVDPNAHKLLGWDDTNGDVRFFIIGSGLSYDAGTDTLTATASSGLLDPGANGIVARTALNTTAARTMQQPAAGITITNPGGVAGDPTFALANDLNALEGLSGTGFAARAASDTWANRTITGTTGQTTVVNGSGASGDPTISLPTTVFLGTPGGSPAAGALTGPDASGTNIAGANLDLHGGKGTGNAVPGSVAVRYPLIGASGTTLQSVSSNFYPVLTNLFTESGFSSISNTTTETSIFSVVGGAAGSTRVIEAGASRAGTNHHLWSVGGISTTGTPTLRIRAYLNSTLIADTGAVTVANNTSGFFWLILDIQSYAIGGSASHLANLRFDYSSGSGSPLTMAFWGGSAGVVAIDTTIAQTIDLTLTWGTASASNAVTAHVLNIDRRR